jgi:hypothetical protein
MSSYDGRSSSGTPPGEEDESVAQRNKVYVKTNAAKQRMKALIV